MDINHIWGIILGPIISVIGWGAAFAFSLRAQNRTFRNQVLDRARIEVTDALRQYQDWLSGIHVEVLTCRADTEVEAHGWPVDWFAHCTRHQDLIGDRLAQLNWMRRLEDYDALFPELSDVRKELITRHRPIMDCLSRAHGALIVSTADPKALKARLKAVEGMEGDVDQVIDQMAMTDDLRVYLDNQCFKVITRARTPYRVPVDPTLPIIVRGKNGKMQIKWGGTPSAPKRTGTRADDQPVEVRTAEE